MKKKTKSMNFVCKKLFTLYRIVHILWASTHWCNSVKKLLIDSILSCTICLAFEEIFLGSPRKCLKASEVFFRVLKRGGGSPTNLCSHLKDFKMYYIYDYDHS